MILGPDGLPHIEKVTCCSTLIIEPMRSLSHSSDQASLTLIWYELCLLPMLVCCFQVFFGGMHNDDLPLGSNVIPILVIVI